MRCLACSLQVNLVGGIDPLPNGRLKELIDLIDNYNDDAERRGDIPNYDLPYRCEVCRASCSEVVPLCKVCVIPLKRLNVTKATQSVTVRKEVYDRILSHITHLCDASILLSLRVIYQRCIMCNLFVLDLVQCSLCQISICRQCMFTFHVDHAFAANRQRLEDISLNEHSRNLLILCDNIGAVNLMVENMAQAI